jgi:hypothetical protein
VKDAELCRYKGEGLPDTATSHFELDDGRLTVNGHDTFFMPKGGGYCRCSGLQFVPLLKKPNGL